MKSARRDATTSMMLPQSGGGGSGSPRIDDSGHKRGQRGKERVSRRSAGSVGDTARKLTLQKSAGLASATVTIRRLVRYPSRRPKGRT